MSTSLTRRYLPTPAGQTDKNGQELYMINYHDKSAGFFPEESTGPALPLPQAKAKAERMTNEYNQQQNRR